MRPGEDDMPGDVLRVCIARVPPQAFVADGQFCRRGLAIQVRFHGGSSTPLAEGESEPVSSVVIENLTRLPAAGNLAHVDLGILRPVNRKEDGLNVVVTLVCLLLTGAVGILVGAEPDRRMPA